MSKRFFFAVYGWVVVLILIVAWGCSSRKNSNAPLAIFDGGQVTIADYVDQFLRSTKYKPNVMPTEANLKKIVFNKAMEKMATREAVAEGLEKDSTVARQLENRESLLLFQQYVQKEIVDSVITERLIRKFYRDFTPQYHMYYILRMIPENASKRYAKAQKDTIQWIYRLLEEGKDFKTLAKKYSQDISTSKKGGDVGFVIEESLGDENLRRVMKTLSSNNYSKPFRGVAGYYILFKGETRNVPVPDFKDVRSRIWQTLYHTRRHDIQKRIDKRFNKLAPRYHYQIVPGITDFVIKKGGTWENLGGQRYVSLHVARFSPGDFSRAAATYDGGKITLGDIFSGRTKNPEDMWEFRKRLYEIAQERLFALDAREKGYSQFPAIQKELENMRDALMRQAIYQQEVMNPVNAVLDSIRSAKEKTLSKSALHDLIVQKRAEQEEIYRGQFEDKMIRTYHFKYVKSNFNQALQWAKEKKLKAVSKRQKS